MKYLASTFSPMMLDTGTWAEIVEIALADVPEGLTSIVSHEVTAKVLSILLGEDVKFNRVNVTLTHGDCLYCVIPKFRCGESREFTREEVEAAGYRCFLVVVK